MIGVVGRSLLSILSDLVFPQGKKYSEIFRTLLHRLLFGFILVVVSQQISLVYDVYAVKSEEFTRANLLYVDEQCASYKGSSQARIKECSELNIIINSWPFVRAISYVVKGYNSCLYLPCGEIVRNIADQLQYKIAFILIALALFSYSFNLIGCTKKKGKDLVDKYRWRQTMAEIQALQQKQEQYSKLNTVDFNTASVIQKNY